MLCGQRVGHGKAPLLELLRACRLHPHLASPSLVCLAEPPLCFPSQPTARRFLQLELRWQQIDALGSGAATSVRGRVVFSSKKKSVPSVVTLASFQSDKAAPPARRQALHPAGRASAQGPQAGSGGHPLEEQTTELEAAEGWITPLGRSGALSSLVPTALSCTSRAGQQISALVQPPCQGRPFPSSLRRQREPSLPQQSHI